MCNLCYCMCNTQMQIYMCKIHNVYIADSYNILVIIKKRLGTLHSSPSHDTFLCTQAMWFGFWFPLARNASIVRNVLSHVIAICTVKIQVVEKNAEMSQLADWCVHSSRDIVRDFWHNNQTHNCRSVFIFVSITFNMHTANLLVSSVFWGYSKSLLYRHDAL